MTDAQLDRLIGAIQQQTFVEGAGWIAWFCAMVIIAGLLCAIWLELRSRRAMTSEEALHILKNAIVELSKRARG
jgi:hypothetical protein